MGAARRLQNEIEAVLKKVKEGVTSFDDTHMKVRAAVWSQAAVPGHDANRECPRSMLNCMVVTKIANSSCQQR